MQSANDQARPVRGDRRDRRAALAAALVGSFALAVGCGDHSSPVALPSVGPPSGPGQGAASASASPLTAKDAVIAAYTGFLSAADAALTAPPEQARRILQGYVTGDYLDWEIRQVMDHQSEHQVPWGKPVIHVTRVDLHPTTAKVHDCQDASNAGLADSRTHQLIPNTRGTANRNLIADLTLGGDDRWRVSGLKQYRAACRVS